MRASRFEFACRFWIFGAIFFVGFFLYNVDPANAGEAILHVFAPVVDPNSARGSLFLRVIFGCGTLLIAGAAAFRTWATAYLRSEVVHDTSQHSDHIVADGPYRYTRNPLYLANFFLALGFGLMASRLGMAFIVLAMLLFDYRLIGREEAGLRASQGEAYLRYLAAVPRLVPSLRPGVDPSGARAHWPQAFAGESMFWMFALAAFLFTVTLSLKVAGPIYAASTVVYLVAIFVLRRRARRRA